VTRRPKLRSLPRQKEAILKSERTQMTAKERPRQLIERVDDDANLQEALDYLAWLASAEPETLTDKELREVEAAEERLARGEFVEWT
jgi:hypothetical protein